MAVIIDSSYTMFVQQTNEKQDKLYNMIIFDFFIIRPN